MQKKNVVHRTFFAIKSDWFHTRKLKYDLTKQHSFNFQCFWMTVQTKRQFVNYSFFFSIRIFFTDTDDSQNSREREGTIFYSTLPLSTAHEHWDIYLQLWMWDDYHVFLITMLVFIRVLLNEIYHLIELPFERLIDDAMFVCLLDELILGFC